MALRVDHGFLETLNLPPITTLPHGFFPSETILEPIKLEKKKGSPSDISDITAVVSYVADNLDIVFSGLVTNQKGVIESVTHFW